VHDRQVDATRVIGFAGRLRASTDGLMGDEGCARRETTGGIGHSPIPASREPLSGEVVVVAAQPQLESIAFKSRKLKLDPLEAAVTCAPSVSLSFVHDVPTLSTRRRGRQIETAGVDTP